MTIAFWCVFIAVILPYVWFGVANSKAGKLRDNNIARDFFEQAQGTAKRALGAHLNTFETNIAFIAGVMVASFVKAPQHLIDGFAVGYVVFRLLHGVLYINDKATLRSLAWFASFVCAAALFFIGL